MPAMPADQVRLLIADVGTEKIFTDEQVETFLDLNAQSPRRAAADALDTIASSEVLVSKVIRTQDLSTDGAKVADALRKHAATLRGLADVEDGADDDGLFDIVDTITPGPGCTRPELTSHLTVWGL